MHQRGDVLNVRRAQVVRVHHLLQCVSRRMRVAAGGVEFERGLGQRPACAQAIHQLARVGVAGHAGGHALWAFQNAARASEATLRQVGGG